MSIINLIDFSASPNIYFHKLKQKFTHQEKGFVNWFNELMDMKSGKLRVKNYFKIEYLFEKELVMLRMVDGVQIPDCLGWRTDKEFLTAAGLSNYHLAKEEIEKLISDETVWRHLVETFGWTDFRDELLYNKEFLSFAIESLPFKNQILYERCPKSLKNDPMIVESFYVSHVIRETYELADYDKIEYSGDPFDISESETLSPHISLIESLRNDPRFIMKCVKRFGRVLAFLDDKYKSDRNYVIEAINQIDGATYCYHNGLLVYASEELRNDKEVVRAAVENWGSCFRVASDSLKKDESFIRELLPGSPTMFDYIDESLMKNTEFLLFALQYQSSAFDMFDDDLKNDREFVIKCAKINGLISIPTQFKADREIFKSILESCVRDRELESEIFIRIEDSQFLDIEFVKELVDIYEKYPDASFPCECCPIMNEEIIWSVIQQNIRKGLLEFSAFDESNVWKDASFVEKVVDLGVRLCRVDYTLFSDELKLKIWKNDTRYYSFPFRNCLNEFQIQAIKMKPECINSPYFRGIIPDLEVEFGYCDCFHGTRNELLRLRNIRLEKLQFFIPERFDTW